MIRLLALASLALAACVPAADDRYSCQTNTDCDEGFVCQQHVCVAAGTDPCTSKNGGCAADATCTNENGQPKCACKSGFTGDGLACKKKSCADSNGGCHVDATCSGEGDAIECKCRAGYKGDGKDSCVKVDCSDANGGCNSNATCSKANDEISCTCKGGYFGDGLTCEAYSCSKNNGGCDAHATCAGDDANVTCTCAGDYEGDGKTCACKAASKSGTCSTALPITRGLAGWWSSRFQSSITKDDAGHVSQWRDLSGNNRNFSSNDGPGLKAAGISGLPALDFAGGKGMKTKAFPLTKDVTVFMVMKWGAGGNYGNLAHHGSRDRDWSIEQHGSDAKIQFQTNDDNSSVNVDVKTTQEYILAGRLGTNRTLAVLSGEGSSQPQGSATTTLTEGNKVLYVGSSDVGEASNATIGEVVYFARALTNDERGQILSYLSAHWGVSPCDAGEQDNDLDSNCKPSCSAANLTDCDANGPCSDGTGIAACFCKEGYAGDGKTCKACDVCGPHGSCDAGATGTGKCNCEVGYEGADCTSCQTNYVKRGEICRTGKVQMLKSAAHENVGGLVEDADTIYLAGGVSGGPTNLLGSDMSLPFNSGFVMGLDKTGARKWSMLIQGTNGNINLVGLVRDAQSNLYVIGNSSTAALTFNGANQISGGSYYLASFTKNGDFRWAKAFQGGGFGGVAVDTTGNLYLAGYANGGWDVGGGGTGNASNDALLFSYTTDGQFRWAKTFGAPHPFHGAPGEGFGSVTTDDDGNVYATGSIGGVTDFGGGALTPLGGGADASWVVASFKGDGAYRWAKMFTRKSTTGWSSGTAITQARGTIAVFGLFRGQYDFAGNGETLAPDPAYDPQPAGGVLLMGTAGSVLKQRGILRGLPIGALDMQFDPNGDVHIVGNVNNGGGDFGAGLGMSCAADADCPADSYTCLADSHTCNMRGGPYHVVYGGTDLAYKEAQVARSGAYPQAARVSPRADGTALVGGQSWGNGINWGFGKGDPDLSNTNDIWLVWFP